MLDIFKHLWSVNVCCFQLLCLPEFFAALYQVADLTDIYACQYVYVLNCREADYHFLDQLAWVTLASQIYLFFSLAASSF